MSEPAKLRQRHDREPMVVPRPAKADAVVLPHYGSPEHFRVRQRPVPRPGSGKCLVRVTAAAVNPIDWRIRQGTLRWLLPSRPPLVLGFDIAGTIVECAQQADSQDGSTAWEPGDEVFGFLRSTHGGGYAQYAIAADDVLVAKPENLSFEEAAAIPLAGSTALQALRKGKLKPEQHVLVNGATGGVGSFAVQLAKHFGARVTAVCSGYNAGFAEDLGADWIIDYQEQDFTQTNVEYDLVFDAAAKSSYSRARRVLARGGSYITTVPSPSSIAWEGLTKFTARKCYNILARPDHDDLQTLAALAAQGKLRVHLDHVFPLVEVAEAHRLSETGHVRGKIVLAVH